MHFASLASNIATIKSATLIRLSNRAKVTLNSTIAYDNEQIAARPPA